MNGSNAEQALRHLRGLVRHWNEFGPEHGLDELMHYASEYLMSVDVQTVALDQFNEQRESAIKRFIES